MFHFNQRFEQKSKEPQNPREHTLESAEKALHALEQKEKASGLNYTTEKDALLRRIRDLKGQYH